MRPPAYADESVAVYLGDVRAVLAEMPDACVDCVVTSPPYWSLRSYLPNDHPDKDCELGLEATPQEYVAAMVAVFEEVRRVLKPHGSLWLNMGDCFATHPNGQSHSDDPTTSTIAGPPRRASRARDGLAALGERHRGGGHRTDVQARERRFVNGRGEGLDGDGTSGRSLTSWSHRDATHKVGADDRTFRDKPFTSITGGLKPKDKVLMPHRLAIALQDAGWYVRQDNVWAKCNPMPESVRDRTTVSHEYVFHLTKSARAYYDHIAVREATSGGAHARWSGNADVVADKVAASKAGEYDGTEALRPRSNQSYARAMGAILGDERNKRSVWTIATQPFRGKHYATFPEALVEPCILAGSSEHGVCAACGKPWAREFHRVPLGATGRTILEPTGRWLPTCRHRGAGIDAAVVLDPFAGSGTTLAVAKRHGRRAVGIDLDSRNVPLIARRCRRERVQLRMFA